MTRRRSRVVLGCVVALSFASCRNEETPRPASPKVTTAQPAAPARLTTEGWGALRIGMTRAEVVAALGEDAQPDAVGGPDPESCDEFRPARAPEGLRVMIEDGRLTRISLSRDADVETEHGFRLGDTAERIKAALGERAVVTPHEYGEAPSEYITVWMRPPTDRGGSSDSNARGIVYEIGADGRVQQIHAGGPSIRYVEGCL